MSKRSRLLMLTVLITVFTAVLNMVQSHAGDVDEWLEAGLLVKELSTHWGNREYQQAKDKIDAKLVEKPGWIPAVILKSAYYRYIEVDNSEALSVLGTIEDSISSLDPEQYKKFLAMYDLYKYDIERENTDNLTEQEKSARRELSHEVFTYFPGSEIAALYFSWVND